MSIRKFLLCGVMIGWFGACTSGTSSTDGNTTWLKSCDVSSDCAAGFTCACGLCTRTCDSESACGNLGPGSACVAPSNLGKACTVAPLPSGPVCLGLCLTANDCRAGQACVDGICARAATTDVDGGARTGDGGSANGGGSTGSSGSGGANDGGSGGTGTGGDAGDNGGASGAGGAGGSSTDRDAAAELDSAVTDAATGTDAASVPDAATISADGGVLAPVTITAIATGSYHSCAIVNGGVQCWGRNSGQLGSAGGSSNVPVQVTGLTSGAQAICAAYDHTCALVNGGVQCWGNNVENQLGNASVPNGSVVPVPVTNLTSGVQAIACGDWHTCAIVNGGVQCWGDNSYRQLGTTGMTTSPVPVQVTNLGSGSGVTAISAGGYTTCAIANGGAYCWGDDYYGQLGDGLNQGSAAVPYQANALASGVQAVGVGDGEYVCAVVAGSLRCSGKLAYAGPSFGPTESDGFVALSPFSGGIQAFSAGYGFFCAIVSGGAECYGIAGHGQLGVSDFSTHVTGLSSGVEAIAAGGYHTCAIVNGGVQCWGWNIDGEIGNGSSAVNVVTPAPVTAWVR